MHSCNPKPTRNINFRSLNSLEAKHPATVVAVKMYMVLSMMLTWAGMVTNGKTGTTLGIKHLMHEASILKIFQYAVKSHPIYIQKKGFQFGMRIGHMATGQFGINQLPGRCGFQSLIPYLLNDIQY